MYCFGTCAGPKDGCIEGPTEGCVEGPMESRVGGHRGLHRQLQVTLECLWSKEQQEEHWLHPAERTSRIPVNTVFTWLGARRAWVPGEAGCPVRLGAVPHSGQTGLCMRPVLNDVGGSLILGTTQLNDVKTKVYLLGGMTESKLYIGECTPPLPPGFQHPCLRLGVWVMQGCPENSAVSSPLIIWGWGMGGTG